MKDSNEIEQNVNRLLAEIHSHLIIKGMDHDLNIGREKTRNLIRFCLMNGVKLSVEFREETDAIY